MFETVYVNVKCDKGDLSLPRDLSVCSQFHKVQD